MIINALKFAARGLALSLPLLSPALYAFEPQSGYDTLSKALQQMQDDDFANPGILTVDRGRELFQKPGYNGKSCASCHGDEGEKLNPRRIAGYPVYDPARGPVTLQNQINACYEERQGEFPRLYDTDELIALETFVRYLARGERVNVDIRGPMQRHYQAGREIFEARIGQRDMACVQCHEHYVGLRLRGQLLTQAQVNGFPSYRISEGRVLSLHQKFTGCYGTLRAFPYQPGSEEFIDLEVYMTARGNGLPIETPAVRR